MTKDDFEFIADRAGFILFFAAPKEKYAKERASDRLLSHHATRRRRSHVLCDRVSTSRYVIYNRLLRKGGYDQRRF